MAAIFPRVDATTRIWTIGHSTRTLEELALLLEQHGVEIVVDVRRFPGSRRLPQFGSDRLAASLSERGIGYQWIETLGGRRRANRSSPATAWRNAAFQAYAEHVTSESFADGLFELTMLGFGAPTAIMCAEVLWWRCHRRIIADVLTSLGIEVAHILDAKTTVIHKIAPPAKLVGGALSYAP